VVGDVTHVWHLFVIRTKDRDALKMHLAEKGIQTAINYRTALPFLKAYEYLHPAPDEFKKAGNHQDEILSLPIFAELKKEQLHFVCKSISDFFTGDFTYT